MPIIPIVGIVGPSGSGKSSSIKSLPKDSTAILNVECKPLPFKEAAQFGKRNLYIKDSKEFDLSYAAAQKDPEIKQIVIESFTGYTNTLAKEGRENFSGWDIWNYYNDKISAFLTKVKLSPKPVFIIAIDEVLSTMAPDGSQKTQRRIKVDGKKLEGKIESDFTIVLYTHVKMEKDQEPKYQFVTNTDGMTSAKSPQGMFPRYINNDLAYVLETANNYWKE